MFFFNAYLSLSIRNSNAWIFRSSKKDNGPFFLLVEKLTNQLTDVIYVFSSNIKNRCHGIQFKNEVVVFLLLL